MPVRLTEYQLEANILAADFGRWANPPIVVRQSVARFGISETAKPKAPASIIQHIGNNPISHIRTHGDLRREKPLAKPKEWMKDC